MQALWRKCKSLGDNREDALVDACRVAVTSVIVMCDGTSLQHAYLAVCNLQCSHRQRASEHQEGLTVAQCDAACAKRYLQHLYSLFSLSMSFLLIWVAWPKDTLGLGVGTMVGRLFLEKAYLEDHRCHSKSGYVIS